METISIDASKKAVGRVASEVARFLQGKHRPDWRAHKVSAVKVVVTNTDELTFTGKKFFQKKYYHHTGTIGHLKEIPLSGRFAEDSGGVLKAAVRRMLPRNRLTKVRMKNLVVYKHKE
jgi:large subunit ribosomal protein L13